MLGAYDFDRDFFQWIDLTPRVRNAGGVTGLAGLHGRRWAILQAVESGLVELGDNFEPLKAYSLPLSRDAHSLIPYEDGFLIADTRRNGVNFARFSADGEIEETEFWRRRRSEQDEFHINSLCRLNDEIFVSGHGEKPEGGWRNSEKGIVTNVSSGEMICENLRHPHSLTVWRGDVYWLESRTSSLYKYSPGGTPEVLTQFKGYTRGLAFDGDYVYVGASAARRYSRSTGNPNQILTDDPDISCCWIYRVNLRTGERERRNMTCFGAEIYDLFAIPTMPKPVEQFTGGYAVTKRLWKIEDDFRSREFVFYQNERSMNEQLVSLQAELEELRALRNSRLGRLHRAFRNLIK